MAERGIKHLSQLSKKAGIEYKKLYYFANKKDKYFDPNLIAALCKALDCEIADLLYLEEEKGGK